MNEVFVQYASYNTWANSQLLATIATSSEEQQQAQIKSSFPSLYKTVLHMLDAESIWWQRIKLQEYIDVPSKNFSGTMNELSAELLRQNKLWQEWVSGLNENGLQHEFIYMNSKKERLKQPVFQMLLHLFNHGTYHRGQIVTMLRQVGVEKIPATDFIVWTRKK